jgi:hypothetical protein
LVEIAPGIYCKQEDRYSNLTFRLLIAPQSSLYVILLQNKISLEILEFLTEEVRY